MPLPPSGTSCAGGTEANRKSVPREMTSLRPLLFFSFKEDTGICAAASPGRTQGGWWGTELKRPGEVGRLGEANQGLREPGIRKYHRNWWKFMRPPALTPQRQQEEGV